MRTFLGLVVVVVSINLGGCGGCNDKNGVGQLPDAPRPPDAPIDMAPPDSVTITVTERGAPRMAQTVFFQESDSALVATMQTGADGKASAIVHAGGFVTVVQLVASEGGPHSQLYTFAGVKPGDDLHVELAPPDPTVIHFDLTVPDEGLGRDYALSSSCGETQAILPVPPAVGGGPRVAGTRLAEAATLTGPVTLFDCGGAADLLVISSTRDAESQVQTMHSWLYEPAKSVADGAPVVLSNDYQDTTDVTFSYTGVAPNLTDLSIVRQLRSGRGNVTYFALPVAPDGATDVSLTRSLPVIAGMTAVTVTAENPSSGLDQQMVVEVGGTGDYTLNFGAVALRRYTTPPAADPGSHAVVWSETSDGNAPDFLSGTSTLQRDGDDGHHTWTWQILAPYTGQARLTYPVLPATPYDYNPAAQEQLSVQQVTTIKATGGYDAFRAHAFDALDPFRAITGATGMIVSDELIPLPIERAAAPRRSLFGRPVPRKR